MFKVAPKLRSNHFLQHLRQKREVGDRSVAGKNFWVHGWLLEDRWMTVTLRADRTLLV